MRKINPITITICSHEGKRKVVVDTEENILSLLREEGIYYSTSCSGRGTCGKCKIQVVEGFIEISPADKEWFREEQLRAGYRLACQAYPVSDCTVVLDSDDENEFEILASNEQVKEGTKEKLKPESSYYVVVDIGTTTIAGVLIGGESHKVLKESTTINHQRVYGGDVISRIQNANEGKAVSLRTLIRKDLSTIIKELLVQNQEIKDKVARVVLACNTTMVHLLMGYSCETLGRFPFTSNHLKTIEEEYREVIGDSYLNCKITILPGISGFVGGDITSGLLAANVLHKKETFLFVDLGTNGEMALGKQDHILVTSAAAGPAFEGGNIQCGVGSIPGAIRNVRIENKRAICETIGEQKPIGICGTGVIATMWELVRNNFVDDTGMLEKDYEDGFPLSLEEPPIVFTQKDIRELQLAKSAIRAGIETLMLRSNTTKESVDVVYLAGGFGFRLDIVQAIGIGLIPEEFRNKIKILGNSSLKGAMEVAIEPEKIEECEALVKKSEELHLSNDPDFNDLYLEHMFFE
ncbi:MAG TPA: DUF4445 domain-containing protein [Candidatus Merdenecus merdavium]|nr:DUF4445 domain-containing protein [Candidatus Merdenecus merdavium]